MIRIEVNIDDSKLVSALENLIELGHDSTPIMRRVAGIMAGATEEAFDTESDPVTGARWAPLAPSTQAARAATEHSGKILQLSGSLAASVSRQYGNGYALVGTNKEYAAAHQFGAVTRAHIICAKHTKALKIPGIGFRKSVDHPGSKIPVRPFLGIGPDHKDEIKDAILEELQEAVCD